MDFSLGEIAEAVKANLIGDPDCRVSGVSSLGNARSGQLSFLANPSLLNDLRRTKATAVILESDKVSDCPVNSLVCEEPYLTYVRAAHLLNPKPEFCSYIHPSSVIEKTANLDSSVYIGASSYIGNNVEIKNGVYIGPGCVIGDGVSIDCETKLVANVTICHNVKIGERVLLDPGVVIGSDGFGLVKDGEKWLKVPHLGRVIIKDDVEIGSNSAVDRGTLDDTIIEEGVKIDNLVQIGHNVVVGAHTVIAGCAAIAGSVTIGKHCMIGGASCIAGHNRIADNVVITGLSGVTNSIKKAGTYSGAMTIAENKMWQKNMVRLRNLDKLARRISELEKKLLKNKM